MTTQNCAECDSRVEPGQSFCDACGAVLSWDSAGARTGRPAPAGTASAHGSGSGSGPGSGSHSGWNALFQSGAGADTRAFRQISQAPPTGPAPAPTGQAPASDAGPPPAPGAPTSTPGTAPQPAPRTAGSAPATSAPA